MADNWNPVTPAVSGSPPGSVSGSDIMQWVKDAAVFFSGPASVYLATHVVPALGSSDTTLARVLMIGVTLAVSFLTKFAADTRK